MNTNQRSIRRIVGAAAGGLIATAFLPMAVASADTSYFYFTPDPTTLDLTQVEGYPPLFDEVTGTELWNVSSQTLGLIFPDFLPGVDTQTTLGSFTNDDFLLSTSSILAIDGIAVPTGTQVDLADFGSGFENEWVDVPGTQTGAGISDLFITPFGDLPILGSFFADIAG
jgi:hypothetical protein